MAYADTASAGTYFMGLILNIDLNMAFLSNVAMQLYVRESVRSKKKKAADF